MADWTQMLRSAERMVHHRIQENPAATSGCVEMLSRFAACLADVHRQKDQLFVKVPIGEAAYDIGFLRRDGGWFAFTLNGPAERDDVGPAISGDIR